MVTNSKEYMKKYYENNKTKMKTQMKQRQKEIVYCNVCQRDITKGNYKSHQKTKKHMNAVENPPKQSLEQRIAQYEKKIDEMYKIINDPNEGIIRKMALEDVVEIREKQLSKLKKQQASDAYDPDQNGYDGFSEDE